MSEPFALVTLVGRLARSEAAKIESVLDRCAMRANDLDEWMFRSYAEQVRSYQSHSFWRRLATVFHEASLDERFPASLRRDAELASGTAWMVTDSTDWEHVCVCDCGERRAEEGG